MKRRDLEKSKKMMKAGVSVVPSKRPFGGEAEDATRFAERRRQLALQISNEPETSIGIEAAAAPVEDVLLDRFPEGLLAEEPLPELPDIRPSPPSGMQDEDAPEKQQSTTQTGQTLQQFITALPRLLSLILEGEASSDVESGCACGKGSCLVQCDDCFNYETSCEDCFIRSHLHNPTHWPKVWQPMPKGFFKTMDICNLRSNSHAIDLCARPKDGACPQPGEIHGVTLVNTNGVHGTRVRYCMCDGVPDFVEQLMRARLFPGTLGIPRTLFTFQCLEEFQAHHLASKKSAYDFMAALRRLTDGAFTLEVPDPYPQFLLVLRVWRRLCLDKWTGQAHNLLSSFPHRTPGSLVLFCPACPEEGFNMEKGWKKTPDALKHLVQEQWTADGNFHLYQFKKSEKNSDPNDVSLETANGIGYFPDEDVFGAYKKKALAVNEKSTCSYLNVVNNQNKSKFKNMKVTGVVNIGCSHTIIRSSVNLGGGEKYQDTDFSIAHGHAHTRHGRSHDDLCVCDRMLSYDCNCQYCVKIRDRFAAMFPELNAVIAQTRFSIPAMHIEDHKDSCKYEFNPAYIPSSGHFHGENAENPWVESNQLGPATCQMNSGNRIGTITAHYSYWNWLKITRMHLAFFVAYKDARNLYQEKREFFLSLSVQHSNRIKDWEAFAGRVETLPNGIRKGLYQHIESKVPTRDEAYQRLLANSEDSNSRLPETTSAEAMMLYEGMVVQHMQERIRGKLTLNQTETVQRDIHSQRTKLNKRLAVFRDLQAVLMPRVSELVAGVPSGPVENEKLCMPSDVPADEWSTRGLAELVDMEKQLREGEVYDCIKSVQAAAKAYSMFQDDKRKNSRGVKDNTRSSLQLKKIEVERNCCIADYNRVRQALVNLKYTTEDDIPVMVVSDTFRRSTFHARQLGDSRRTDGRLYTISELVAESDDDLDIQKPNDLEIEDSGGGAATQMHRRRRGPRKQRVKDGQGADNQERQQGSGWIWAGKLTMGAQCTSEDLAAYEEESDRIQWFRAKEDMERWREVCEKIQAEFRNCIRGFGRMREVWAERGEWKQALAGSSHTAWSFGHRAYARRQAAMYAKLQGDCKKAYIQCNFRTIAGDPLFSNGVSEGEDRSLLAEMVASMRIEVQAKDDAAVAEQLSKASLDVLR